MDATGGSPDGVGDHAKAAGKGKAGAGTCFRHGRWLQLRGSLLPLMFCPPLGLSAGVKAPDYVKVDDRLPAMSSACFAQLTREVTAAVGSAGGGGSHEQVERNQQVQEQPHSRFKLRLQCYLMSCRGWATLLVNHPLQASCFASA